MAKKVPAWKKKLGKVDRKELRKAAKEEAARQKAGGGNPTITMPDGVEAYKVPKEDQTDFTLLPFLVPESGQRRFANRRDGTPWFSLQYVVHRNVGPADDRVICPIGTGMGNKCAVCDEYNAARKEWPNATKAEYKEHIAPFKGSVRDLFLVYDHDEEKLLMLDFSNWNFGKALAVQIGYAEKRGESLPFMLDEPDGDVDVRTTWVTEGKGGFDVTEASSITFVPRKTQVPDDIIELAMEIDPTTALLMLDADSIYNKLHGVDAEDENTADTDPEPGEEPDPDPDPDPEEEGLDVDEMFDAIKELEPEKDDMKQARKLYKAEDEDGLAALLATLQEVDDVPSDAAGEAAEGECPAGYKFGVDTDQKPKCADCDSAVWDACFDAKEAAG